MTQQRGYTSRRLELGDIFEQHYLKFTHVLHGKLDALASDTRVLDASVRHRINARGGNIIDDNAALIAE